MNKLNPVLILGANSDIGFSIAKKFYENGYDLILTGKDPEKFKLKYLDFSDARIIFTHFDALDCNMHHDFFNRLRTTPLIVICVFGYLGDQNTAEKKWGEAEQIIDVNYKGAVSILNIIAENLKKQKKGIIVGISSVAGDRGRESNFIYGSAKAGFTAYLSGLRQSLFKSGVHVLTVKPGYVATKMTQNMKLPKILTIKPDELAEKIYTACMNKSNLIYSNFTWRLIMIVIRCIPESIFKRLKL